MLCVSLFQLQHTRSSFFIYAWVYFVTVNIYFQQVYMQISGCCCELEYKYIDLKCETASYEGSTAPCFICSHLKRLQKQINNSIWFWCHSGHLYFPVFTIQVDKKRVIQIFSRDLEIFNLQSWRLSMTFVV